MKTLEVKLRYMLLLLSLCYYRCESLIDISLHGIFFPFGSDEGDTVVDPEQKCVGYISIPYRIFNKTTVYVR